MEEEAPVLGEIIGLFDNLGLLEEDADTSIGGYLYADEHIQTGTFLFSFSKQIF